MVVLKKGNTRVSRAGIYTFALLELTSITEPLQPPIMQSIHTNHFVSDAVQHIQIQKHCWVYRMLHISPVAPLNEYIISNVYLDSCNNGQQIV